MKFSRTRKIVESSFSGLNQLMANLSRYSHCAGINELTDSGFYKKKYAAYSIYTCAMTSCPILHRVGTDAEIRNSVISKAANVIAVKVMDNLNDSYHSLQRARQSLPKHRDSFIASVYGSYNNPIEFADMAENSTFLMGRWNHDLTWRSSQNSYCFKLFKNSVDRYIQSQMESLKQKIAADFTDNLSLRYYFEKIASKGNFGNVWLDIDFATIERHMGIDREMKSVIRDLKIGLELFSRSLLLYDDVSDFDDDLRDGILNAVALYALEAGYLRRKDLLDVENLRRKVDRRVMGDVIGLGDLLFAKAIEHFERARSCSEEFLDIDAYISSSRLIRIFVMRKWAFGQQKLKGLDFSLRSFYDSTALLSTLPERVSSYGHDLLSCTEPYIELVA